MFRTRFLVFLFTMLLAGLPAMAQTTPNTPVPPPANGRHHYPLKRIGVAVHLLGNVSAADRALLRKEWLLSVRQQLLVSLRPLLPNIARPPMDEEGAAVLFVRVNPQGMVTHIRVVRSSGSASLQTAARGAVKAATPLPVFPPGVKARTLRLRVRFVYG